MERMGAAMSARAQFRRRHLVQQGLEEVVVAAVDHGDLHLSARFSALAR
jgi:hypothetical protein